MNTRWGCPFLSALRMVSTGCPSPTGSGSDDRPADNSMVAPRRKCGGDAGRIIRARAGRRRSAFRRLGGVTGGGSTAAGSSSPGRSRGCRLHLGKTTSQAGCFCSRFVLSLQKTDCTSAKQPRKRGCLCARFVLSLQKTDCTTAKQPRRRVAYALGAIFTEDRLYLGKTTSQAGCFCSRFVLSLPQTNLAI